MGYSLGEIVEVNRTRFDPEQETHMVIERPADPLIPLTSNCKLVDTTGVITPSRKLQSVVISTV